MAHQTGKSNFQIASLLVVPLEREVTANCYAKLIYVLVVVASQDIHFTEYLSSASEMIVNETMKSDRIGFYFFSHSPFSPSCCGEMWEFLDQLEKIFSSSELPVKIVGIPAVIVTTHFPTALRLAEYLRWKFRLVSADLWSIGKISGTIWFFVELPGAPDYMSRCRMLFDRGKTLKSRNGGTCTVRLFRKEIIAIQLWPKEKVPVVFINMLESIVWDWNRGEDDTLQHGNENSDLVDLHYWDFAQLKPCCCGRLRSWVCQPTKSCIQFKFYEGMRVIQLVLNVLHITSCRSWQSPCDCNGQRNAQFECVLARIPVWILAKVFVSLQDAYLVFGSIAISAYQTGSGEGYKRVCCWAYKLRQLPKGKVSCLQGRDGFTVRYNISLKQPYSSLSKKVQKMVMSGSHVVTENKSLLIHACAIPYEEEDSELHFHIIATNGNTTLMQIQLTRTPSSQDDFSIAIKVYQPYLPRFCTTTLLLSSSSWRTKMF